MSLDPHSFENSNAHVNNINSDEFFLEECLYIPMYKKYLVALTTEQRKTLINLVSTGKASARRLTRARILLMTDSGQAGKPWTDEAISRALNVSSATIQRVRQQFVEEGLAATIGYKPPRRIYERKINEEAKALLIIFYYTDPPEGRRRWTAKLLAQELTKAGFVSQISHETVRNTLRERGVDICK